MMIRVLQVVTDMNMGGIENFIMNIYRNIDRSKVQFDFLKHRDNNSHFDEEIRSLGGKIYHVPPVNPLIGSHYKKELKHFFENHKEYSIVHSHINANSMYVLRAAKKAGVKTRIAHSHTASQVPSLSRKIINWYSKQRINKFTTHNFACSMDAGNWLFGHKGTRDKKFAIIRNSIKSSKFQYNQEVRYKIRKQYQFGKRFVVGHIGSFTYPKNHNYLIDIFAEIVKANDNALLILVGDGPLIDDIKEKVKNLDLEKNVIFTGIVTNTNEILQAMDIYLMPSIFEGLPVTLIEAQASGIKCFVSDDITQEVAITNLVKFVSLEDSPSVWGNEILKYQNGYERKNMKNEIIESGYDVQGTAKWLESFYLENI